MDTISSRMLRHQLAQNKTSLDLERVSLMINTVWILVHQMYRTQSIRNDEEFGGWLDITGYCC